MKFSTKAVHVGSVPDPITGAVMSPLYMTSTYELDAPGETRGYDYTRAGNPNFTMLEQLLASLEDGKHATVFSSGIGALTALASSLSPGDKVLALDGIYGGTYRFFTQVFNRFGILFETLDLKKSPIAKALEQKPKWLLFETPTNPLLDIFDIEALTSLARKYGVLSVVDNTFATPYFQNPLHLGADVVWHSTTKYINGHSDIIGGAMVTNDDAIKHRLDFMRKSIGVNPSPFDVWLTIRGVKTLPLRMEKHHKNAQAIAEFLSKHKKVKKVYYPGLPSHRGYEIAKKQMRGFSGMVSAEFDLSIDKTKKLLTSFKYFTLAESLGGVESLVNHPALMTHATVPEDERLRLGITDSLTRFSVGIEDADDLIDDLKAALESI